MDPDVAATIARIHDTPTQAVVYVTGGASHALAWLQNVPGASATLLTCAMPYSRAAFEHTLDAPPAGIRPTSYASRDAARALARAAYRAAVRLAPPGARVVGVAATCALARATPSDRARDRAHVALHDASRGVDYAVTLADAARGGGALRDAVAARVAQDVIASRLVVQALADGCGVGDTGGDAQGSDGGDALSLSGESGLHVVRDALRPGDELLPPRVAVAPSPPFQAVLRGSASFAERVRGCWNIDAGKATLLLPGSFNPLHDGHRRLMAAARRRRPGMQAAYELCVDNVDKAAIDEAEVARRIAQFRTVADAADDGDEAVVVASAPLFADKARLYPGACFVVGADTAVRIVMPKYYGGQAGLVRAMADLRARGVTFLVAGRVEQRKGEVQGGDATFQGLSDVRVPEGFEDMFEAISESEFRMDISSSELRARGGNGGDGGM